jgi:alpha/beta superfamily hydrolase
MSKTSTRKNFFLDGPAGRLEAILEHPSADSPLGCAVVCHPHPKYGGTMNNKVAHTLARAFVREGFAVLRFNFRGTELSDGEYDAGIGELDDAVAALHWLQARYPGLPGWVSGFSFGAAIAVQAAMAVKVDGLISIAPAVNRFSAELAALPDIPWLVVQGDEDELVDVEEIVRWVNSLDPGPELLILPGAEHFFHGRLVELREALMAFVRKQQVWTSRTKKAGTSPALT